MREETRCHQMDYSFRLTARVLLYAPSHRQDNTYHGICYTSRGALAQWVHSMKDRSDDPSHHERMLLPRIYISLLQIPRLITPTIDGETDIELEITTPPSSSRLCYMRLLIYVIHGRSAHRDRVHIRVCLYIISNKE